MVPVPFLNTAVNKYPDVIIICISADCYIPKSGFVNSEDIDYYKIRGTKRL